MFTANFTAIDFETANHRPDSACQLAAVKVRDGKIVDSAMWMIRPQPFFFTRSNIRIHGITPQRVEDEAEFGDLWEEVSETFGDDCLVAHNAGFDIGVLLACLRRHRQAIPELHFTCTRAIARATWPSRPRYGLKPLSDWLGVRFKHHDALEDSIACAKVLLAAGIDKQVASMEDLEKSLRLERGKAGDWGYQGARRRRGRSSRRSSGPQRRQLTLPELPLPDFHGAALGQKQAPYDMGAADHEQARESTIDLQRLLIRADFIRPLSGKCVVFSGKLRTLSFEEAHRLTTRAGGDCQDAVNRQTNLVVIGEPTSSADRDPVSVQRQADDLRQSGAAIQILSEDEFIGLVVSHDR